MERPPDADPVAAERIPVDAISDSRRVIGEVLSPTSKLVRSKKPGTTLITDPKPTAQAVFIIAVTAPLEPSVSAVGSIFSLFTLKIKHTRMPSIRAIIMFHFRRLREIKTTTRGSSPDNQCQEGKVSSEFSVFKSSSSANPIPSFLVFRILHSA